MSLTINTNIAGSIAYRSLSRTQSHMDASLRKLASGQRVSMARDDAAAMAIGSRLKAELAALRQHTQIATQTSSMLQVAEGAYQRGEEMLVRMRSLAVQAQSSSLSATERNMLNQEYVQLRAEMTRMAAATTFNGVELFDTAALSFQQAQNFSPGNNTNSIAMADMNGDGILDAIRGRQGSGVYVFYGNGDGTFATTAATTIATLSPAFVQARDIDSDGVMDLVYGDGGTVNFYKNDGRGNLTAHSSVAYAGAFDVGDVNGDGLADVVHQTGGTLSVSINSASGTFTTQTYAVTNSAQVTIMDLDNDGDNDIGLLNGAGTQQLINGGNGGFTTQIINGTGGANTGNFFAVDANNDGYLDLAASDGVNISIYLNNRNGTFANEQAFVMSAVGTQQAAYVGDINGDGYVDLVSMGTAGTALSMRMGTGVMTFAAATSYTMAAAASNLAWGDMNRDGRVDILFGNSSGNPVQSVLNTSTMGLEGSVGLGGLPGSGGINYRIGAMTLNGLDNQLQYSSIDRIGSARRAEQSILRALNVLRNYRASVGATINRLDAAQTNLATTLENLENARSSYMDLDVAQEMSTYISQKILSQSGIAMIAQSRQSQKQLLRLFTGASG